MRKAGLKSEREPVLVAISRGAMLTCISAMERW